MSKIVLQNRWYIIIGLIITGVQLLFDTLNVSNIDVDAKVLTGASSMGLALIVSGYKTYLDPNTANATLWVQVLLFLVYVCGGILEILDKMPIADDAASITRTILTFVTSYIPVIITTYNNLDEYN